MAGHKLPVVWAFAFTLGVASVGVGAQSSRSMAPRPAAPAGHISSVGRGGREYGMPSSRSRAQAPRPHAAASHIRSVGRGGTASVRYGGASRARAPKPYAAAGHIVSLGRSGAALHGYGSVSHGLHSAATLLNGGSTPLFDDWNNRYRGSFGGHDYYYRGDRYYRSYRYGDDVRYQETRPPAGVRYDYLPAGATPTRIEGKTVYRRNDVFYEAITNGFQVVDWPQTAAVGEPAWVAEFKGERNPADILRAMGAFLAGQQAFRIGYFESLKGLVDNLEITGSASSGELEVERERGVRLSEEDAGSKRLAVYDRRHVYVLDEKKNQYTVLPAAETIEATLDILNREYGMTFPLGDFLRADCYERLVRRSTRAEYRGLNAVGTRQCHHLAFSWDTIDWEVWIQPGEQPLPRKLLIIYKLAEGQPRYEATLNRWDLEPALPAEDFSFTPPAGAVRVEVRPADSGPSEKETE